MKLVFDFCYHSVRFNGTRSRLREKFPNGGALQPSPNDLVLIDMDVGARLSVDTDKASFIKFIVDIERTWLVHVTASCRKGKETPPSTRFEEDVMNSHLRSTWETQSESLAVRKLLQ